MILFQDQGVKKFLNKQEHFFSPRVLDFKTGTICTMKTLSMDDFENLYRQYGPMVLRRCRFILKNEEKALDAMQDTFVRLIERKEKITNVCSSLLYTMATNVCLNKIRSDKLRAGPEFDVIAEIIEDTASAEGTEQIETSILLDCIFSERDTKDRQIAILHYVDGYTLEETSTKMKMSVSGIRKRLEKLKEYAGGRYGNSN